MKILLAIMAIIGLTMSAFATNDGPPEGNGPPDLCSIKPWLPMCGGEVGPQGPKGDKGDRGRRGKQGKTGSKGDTGKRGKNGRDGADGENGQDGADGESSVGTNGVSGTDGTNGADGSDGSDGSNGSDGTDGSDGVDGRDGIDSDPYRLNALEDYALDSAAGNMAVAAIDFGQLCAGETEVGIGVGHSSSVFGSSTAVGLGLKHGLTEADAIIVKGWSTGSDNYGVGAAATHRF